MSDRTSVARTAEGLVRLRTPEGQTIILTPERAIEWSSRRGFQDSLRFAAMNCPALDKVIEEPTEDRP